MPEVVDIIVVNWNSGSLTMRAIEAYLNYQSPKLRCNVIIVDNASTDNSRSLFEGKLNNVIYNPTNEGFGKACNQAYEVSSAEANYILLLNPDTVSDPGVLEILVDFLNHNPEYGATGPKQVGEKGNVLRSCVRFPSFKTALFEVTGLSKVFPRYFLPAPIMMDWDHSESRDVDHVMGSYMLIRKAIVDKIGFMDESYFTYYEDVDLSKRIAEEGFKSFYNHECLIYHKGGGSGEEIKSQRLYYSLSSRSMYWRKYLGKYKALTLVIMSFLIEPFLRIIDSAIKEGKLSLAPILKAYFLHFKKL
jgi:GT2 family glycosyltransferase